MSSEDVKSKVPDPETTPAPTPPPFSSLVTVDVHGASHRGNVRENNEDHFLVLRGGRFLEPLQGNVRADILFNRFDEVFYGIVVADGLGGALGGEVASRRAIESLISIALHRPDWILRLGKPELYEVMWRMADGFVRVHAALLHDAAENPSLKGMATTMTLAVTLGDDLILTHVGDSRAYLLRDGHLKQLTRDHSVAQEMVDRGQVGQHDRLVRELRNVLNQALGAKALECLPDVQHLKLSDGDRLLLCTNGLTDMVDAGSIEEVLKRDAPARVIADTLLNLALGRGGRDNVTTVVATYSIPDAKQK